MSSRIPFVFFQILKHDIKSKWTLDIQANHEVQRRRRYKIKSETARFLLFRDPKYKLDHKLHLESRIVKVFLKRFANSFAWWTFVKTMKNLTWELISMKFLMKFYSGTCIHLWVILQLKNFVQWPLHLLYEFEKFRFDTEKTLPRIKNPIIFNHFVTVWFILLLK